jgi:hypothetical protein
MRPVMDEPVILDGHKKNAQKVELLAKFAEHFCKMAEKGDPEAIKTLGIQNKEKKIEGEREAKKGVRDPLITFFV